MNSKDTLYLVANIKFQQQKQTQAVCICRAAHPAPYFNSLPSNSTVHAMLHNDTIDYWVCSASMEHI